MRIAGTVQVPNIYKRVPKVYLTAEDSMTGRHSSWPFGLAGDYLGSQDSRECCQRVSTVIVIVYLLVLGDHISIARTARPVV